MTILQKHQGKAAKDGAVNALRVMRAALGELLGQGAVAEVSALAVGCVVLLTRHAAQKPDFVTEGSRTQDRTAQSLLALKGLSGQDAELVLEALSMTGLILRDAGYIEIPQLDAALAGETASLANRKAGWVKRTAGALPAATSLQAREIVKPDGAPASATVSDVTSLSTTASTIEESQTPARQKLRASRRIVDGVEYRRINALDSLLTDPEQDPIVVRVVCKGEGIAELTASYVAHLQSIFKMVDVEQELRQCSAWAEANPTKRKTFSGIRRFLTTWLTNATQSAHIRGAVTRASTQRNGFGQGGSYKAAAAEQASEQGSLLASLEDDGLGDLLAPAATDAQASAAAEPLPLVPDQATEGKTRLSLVPSAYRTTTDAVSVATPPTRRLSILERIRANRGSPEVAARQ
jgi:hypothetical protein